MAKKFTIEQIKKFVGENSKCKLLSNEYINNHINLKFQCNCGNIFYTTFINFAYENKKHCDECGKKILSNLHKFSYKDVKKYVEQNSNCKLLSDSYKDSKTKLKFRCSCGNEFYTTFSKFKNRDQRQCNECGKELRAKERRISYEGVKKYVENNSGCKLLSTNYKNNHSILKFKCSCGDIFYTTFNKFKDRNKRQCNKCGGKLTAKARRNHYEEVKKFVEENSDCKLLSSSYENNLEKLKLQCSCGNIFYTSFANFRTHNKNRCRICSHSISKAELKISKLLSNMNINYISQCVFKDCKDINSLPFDFYLPDYNICVETDGEQHFKPVEIFGGEMRLKKQQEHDQIKNQYCKENGINLIRIPYTEFNNIETILKSVLP